MKIFMRKIIILENYGMIVYLIVQAVDQIKIQLNIVEDQLTNILYIMLMDLNLNSNNL